MFTGNPPVQTHSLAHNLRFSADFRAVASRQPWQRRGGGGPDRAIRRSWDMYMYLYVFICIHMSLSLSLTGPVGGVGLGVGRCSRGRRPSAHINTYIQTTHTKSLSPTFSLSPLLFFTIPRPPFSSLFPISHSHIGYRHTRAHTRARARTHTHLQVGCRDREAIPCPGGVHPRLGAAAAPASEEI